MTHRMALAALAGVAALTLAACGGSEGTAPPRTVRVERATVDIHESGS